MSALTFKYEHRGQYESLIVSGGIDVQTFPLFEAVLENLAANGTGVLDIDLRDVDVFTSPAVGALVMLSASRRGHGGIMHLICKPDGAVAPIIRRSKLEGVFSLKLLPAD